MRAERPLIFRAEMVRAILAGKTQTRRIIKGDVEHADPHFCPHGRVGDRLWVRETWGLIEMGWPNVPVIRNEDGDPCSVAYRADGWVKDDSGERDCWRLGERRDYPGPWRSPIYMLRAASRILLEITDVRCQRLQEITEEDARAEGAELTINGSQRGAHGLAFAALWDEIHGAGAWIKNPFVWALSFKRMVER